MKMVVCYPKGPWGRGFYYPNTEKVSGLLFAKLLFAKSDAMFFFWFLPYI